MGSWVLVLLHQLLFYYLLKGGWRCPRFQAHGKQGLYAVCIRHFLSYLDSIHLIWGVHSESTIFLLLFVDNSDIWLLYYNITLLELYYGKDHFMYERLLVFILRPLNAIHLDENKSLRLDVKGTWSSGL